MDFCLSSAPRICNKHTRGYSKVPRHIMVPISNARCSMVDLLRVNVPIGAGLTTHRSTLDLFVSNDVFASFKQSLR